VSAGYSGTPLGKKLGLQEGMCIALIDAPNHYKKLVGKMPTGVKEVRPSKRNCDFIHFFAKSNSVLKVTFPRLKLALKESGSLWVSWPKGTSKLDTDLKEDLIRKVGLSSGLVDVKVCAVDETWSGLKFVYRLTDRSGSESQSESEPA
jgi:hypothetical protein